MAACSGAVHHSATPPTTNATTATIPPTTTTTVALTAAQWLSTYGGIFAILLNDLAAINGPDNPTGSQTGVSLLRGHCAQLQTDVEKAQSLPTNASPAAGAAISAMLNQDISGMAEPWDTAPTDAGTLAAAPGACLSDPDPLDTFGHQAANDHIFVIVSGAPALIQAAQSAAQAAAPGVPVPTPINPVTVGPQVLVNQSGTGAADLPVFTVPGTDYQGWTLTWSYDCSTFGTQGNFIVSIYVSNGGDPYNQGTLDTNDPGVNELGSSGSNTETYTDAGTFALKVNSECSWTVKTAYQPTSAYGSP